MQKKLGAILLIAGTCIGSGMIALPIVLAKLGLMPSIILMLVTWSVMYYTSLTNLELNLQAGEGLTLGKLGKQFSGCTAGLVGAISLKLLSYALLSAYIYGGSSILYQLCAHNISLSYITSLYALVCGLILLLPIQLVDYVNRILFLGLLAIVAILIGGLSTSISYINLPLIEPSMLHSTAWRIALPVVFTSFGFQVIFHTLMNYCEKNSRILQQAFLWGSFLPAIVYIVWTSGVLSTLHYHSPVFYQQMLSGTVELGSLIQELSAISHWNSLKNLIWWTSLLAITTSVIGVGIGLFDSFKTNVQSYVHHSFITRCLAALITLAPAYIAATIVPNAFITILGFAGMILVVIAILLPTYLLYTARIKTYHYPILQSRFLNLVVVAFGLLIILCELYNMTAH